MGGQRQNQAKVSFEFDENSPQVLKSPSHSGIISSVKETEIDVVFHDPKGFLKDAVIHYFWFINTVNYGQTPTVSVVLQHCCSSVLSALLRFHIFQGRFEYNFTVPGDYDVEVTAIAYFNSGINLSSQCYCRICKYHMNLAEPNSTLEQTSLNAVGRDIGPELGLREVKIECQVH